MPTLRLREAFAPAGRCSGNGVCQIAAHQNTEAWVVRSSEDDLGGAPPKAQPDASVATLTFQPVPGDQEELPTMPAKATEAPAVPPPASWGLVQDAGCILEQTVQQHSETLMHVGDLLYSLQEEGQ